MDLHFQNNHFDQIWRASIAIFLFILGSLYFSRIAIQFLSVFTFLWSQQRQYLLSAQNQSENVDFSNFSIGLH